MDRRFCSRATICRCGEYRAIERSALPPWLWIKDIAEEEHFASRGTAIWASGAARDSAVAYLQQHRIFELPMLTDIMPHLFEPQVESLQDGVARLYGARRDAEAPPPYAKLNDRVLA